MEVGPLVNERSKFNLLSARRKLGFFGSKWRMHSGKTPAKKKKKKGVFGRRRSLFWTSDTMPTIRYRIRNEYGLGGSELYGAADKNDPEALLEGVAAAGLVGLLRQLGDLAEYVSSCYFPCVLVLRPGIVDWTMSFAPCSFLWVGSVGK